MESPTSALKELAPDAARGNEQTQDQVAATTSRENTPKPPLKTAAKTDSVEKALSTEDAARIEKLKGLSISEMMYPMTNGLKEFGLNTTDQTLFAAWEDLFQSERKEEARAAFDLLVANLTDQPIPDEAMSSSDSDVEDKPEAKKQKRACRRNTHLSELQNCGQSSLPTSRMMSKSL